MSEKEKEKDIRRRCRQRKKDGKLRHALPSLTRPRRSTDFRPEEVYFLDNELLHAFD